MTPEIERMTPGPQAAAAGGVPPRLTPHQAHCARGQVGAGQPMAGLMNSRPTHNRSSTGRRRRARKKAVRRCCGCGYPPRRSRIALENAGGVGAAAGVSRLDKSAQQIISLVNPNVVRFYPSWILEISRRSIQIPRMRKAQLPRQATCRDLPPAIAWTALRSRPQCQNKYPHPQGKQTKPLRAQLVDRTLGQRASPLQRHRTTHGEQCKKPCC